jgi:phage shock protein E
MAVPRQIGRDDVQAMSAAGVVVVDVLPDAEYEEEHIPGAIHIPLKKLDVLAPERLAPDRPVIVYCYDAL